MGKGKKITNVALVEIELCDKLETIKSNEAEVDVINLKVTKKAGCKFAFCGGTIKYTVAIFNDSDVKLEDLEFKDALADNTQFVTGSFKVDGVTKTPVISGKTISYLIKEIKAEETVTITFEVKVKCEDEEEDD